MGNSRDEGEKEPCSFGMPVLMYVRKKTRETKKINLCTSSKSYSYINIHMLRSSSSLSPRIHTVSDVHAAFERYTLKFCTRV